MSLRFTPQPSLRAPDGRRKYLTPDERQRFIETAWTWPDPSVGTLCLLLAYSGCRISEALALAAAGIDHGERCIAFRSLKKRGAVVIRTVPLPDDVIARFLVMIPSGDARLWPISRSTAWQRIKSVMQAAGIGQGIHATPKGLRHGFGIHAIRSGVPLNLVQRWLGHADIATTAIYTDALGAEEREFAGRMWGESQSIRSESLSDPGPAP
ncbi:tyrosine-type recombinase/integrase [uncultured Devosia sp.]|uniref:tyrosine-type recombinase/integrase n=1 Tax=uncultured Devosia sp. TaxID=211434 RepID=UPI002610FC0F|nr:tyrosine-type recombinase/integrase [uncultured Devosia sp.]